MQTSLDIEYELYNPARALARTPVFRLLVLLIAQVALAYLMYRSAAIATIHAVVVLVVGLWLVMRDEEPIRVAYLVGYAVGAEVLWRMTDAKIFWEFGKYAVGLILILAILKWRMRLRPTPVVYFVVLLPSMMLLFNSVSLWQARDQISFNLSGPFALAISTIFFSQIRLTSAQVRQLWIWIIVPIIGIAFLTLSSTLSATSLNFSERSSNFVTSGGFGPNQVSAMLGLGALLCWLYCLVDETAFRVRWILLMCGVWLAVQSLLTFSRAGMWNFAAAAPVATLYLLRGHRQRKSLFLIFLLLFVALYFVLPRLQNFTNGELEARFTSTDTHGRDLLWQTDFKIWQDHLITGVGPGQAGEYYAPIFGGLVASHTEYSRLLSEHGMFGLVAILLLGTMLIRAFLSAKGSRAKGVVIGCMLWSLAEMTHAGMRIVAISFLFALPSAYLFETEETV
jgi:hypothetical protein